ncbi:MAG: VWA domain-containing protein, partial [Deltaproteobacteria bacterium]|nr:VWA domain-containing protein [Deltaproteobacteria bacterium]
NKAVEAVYKFPLPEGCAVCGFNAHVDGRVICGEVEEREMAFELYDDAIMAGDGGYLLDEERPNIFSLSVGNLNPGAEAVIEIEYITLLDVEGAEIRFFLPTAISPRYIPEEMGDEGGISPDDRIHPPYASDVPYGLAISLNIHGGNFLEAVSSPSHQVKIENMHGDPVRVCFAVTTVKMDRDFVLHMAYKKGAENRAYLQRADEEAFIQLDLCLNHEGQSPQDIEKVRDFQGRREIIFLLDCSGSMDGDSIREAKSALEICLRGLESGNIFNIYRFGSSYERLFPESATYSEQTLEKALGYLRIAKADLGGTEILKPIKKIVSEGSHDETKNTEIILITDGEVGNEEEIFKIIRKYKDFIRMFAIGIGAGCNEYFIKGAARAGRGASEFIYPGERIEPKVLRIFSKATLDTLDDPKILWGTESPKQAPAAPVFFMGSPQTIFARIRPD